MLTGAHRYLLLISLCLSNIFLAFKFSIQGPLYPPEASSKGLMPSEYGFTVSVYETMYLFASATSAALMNQMGVELCYVSGSFLAGIGSIAFGLLHYIDDPTLFLIISFIIKAIEGIGSASVYITVTVLISSSFREGKALYLSIKETFFSLGTVIGPMLGGLLRDITDFRVPFIITGSLIIASALFSAIVLYYSNSNINPRRTTPTFRILSLPGMWIGLLSTMLAYTSAGFINLTLEPYIRVFKYSAFRVSLFFALPSLVFALISPFVGKLLDMGMHPLIGICLGTVSHTVCFLFFGPVPSNNPQVWSVSVALVLNGIGIASMIISGLIQTLNTCRTNNYEDVDEEAFATAGISLWACAIAFGGVIGPILGGVLTDSVGIILSSYFLCCVNITFLTLVVIVFVIKTCTVPHTIIPVSSNTGPTTSGEFTETSPLLS